MVLTEDYFLRGAVEAKKDQDLPFTPDKKGNFGLTAELSDKSRIDFNYVFVDKMWNDLFYDDREMQDSYGIGTGITLNISIPLDRSFQKRCKSAVDTQIGIQNQKLKNLELEWHVARIKHCGELKQKGIRVTKVSPFYSVCSDVFLVPKPNQIEKHYHSLSSSEQK